MKKGLVRNTIVLIIVLSFFGTAVVIGISTDQSKISKNSIEDKQYNNDTEIINQNKIKLDNLIENKNLSYTMNQKTPISSFKRSTTLYVGGSGVGNYSTIQSAINSAENGDTIYVYNGTYQEKILVNKTLNLIGENRDNTIINAYPYNDNVIVITSDNVTIKNFTIRGGGTDGVESGITISANNTVIKENAIIYNRANGIIIYSSNNTLIKSNYIHNNSKHGIYMYDICENLTISSNTIEYNTDEGIRLRHWIYNSDIFNNIAIKNGGHGIRIWKSLNLQVHGNWLIENNEEGINVQYDANLIYHNNFINNTRNGYGNAIWDNGYPYGGNYWDDYNGSDDDQDDIGDVPYLVEGSSYPDRYPLMEPWGTINRVPFANFSYYPSEGGVNQTIIFNASKSVDVDGYIALFEWDWDDDGIFDGTGAYITHYWSTSGMKNVTLKVYDNEGKNDTLKRTIRIKPSAILYVDDDYNSSTQGWHTIKWNSIQDAIDNASDSDTIFVYNGVYRENIILDKSIELIGENRTNTIIESNGINDIISVIKNNFLISKFTIKNNGKANSCGINVNCSNGVISKNIIKDNYYGIKMNNSSCNNLIFQNNFYNNTINAYDQDDNFWDNGFIIGGNYWDDYTGNDTNYDGIGDIAYNITGNGGVDRYPLIISYETNLPAISDVNAIPQNQIPNATINISCIVNDSIGIKNVRINITYPDQSININESMQKINITNKYCYECNFSNLGTYEYFIWAEDRYDNTNISAVNIFKIVPTEVWVDDDYNYSTPGWGFDHFNSIGSGIGHVATNGTVNIQNGTYVGEIHIEKSVTLLGENKYSTIIDGGSGGGGPGEHPAIVIYQNWVTLDNLGIKGGGWYPNIADVEVESSNVTIKNCNISGDGYRNIGIWYTTVENITIENNIILSRGIELFHCDNSENMLIKNNTICEVFIWNYGNNITLQGNIIYEAFVGPGKNHIICGNTINELGTIGEKIIIENNILQNSDKSLVCYGGENCTIRNNVFKSNNVGMQLGYDEGFCKNFNIYYNNFLENTIQVDLVNIENISWDNGYPSKGNYWDDYNGPDSNFDGIGDIPYTISGSNQDLYPLMTPYGPPSADFTFIRYNKSVIFNASRSYDYDGYIELYDWDFGDNENSSGEIVCHNFSDYGAYDVTLKVTDNENIIDIFTKKIFIDNTPPEIFDFTPLVGYTGDLFIFNVTVLDNFNVSNVFVEYFYDFGDHINISMNNVFGDFWEKSINVVNTLEFLNYKIIASDIAGNWNSTNTKSINIFDNDYPEITDAQAVPFIQNSNGYVNISANITDNIEVSEVFLNIIYPDFSSENFSIMQNITNNNYFCNKSYSQFGNYLFYFWVKDSSGNSKCSNNFSFRINYQPYIPSNPNPFDGKLDVDINADLSWIGGDPDPGDTVTYDIYLDDSSPPSLVVSNYSDTNYNPWLLNYNETYYWQIVSWDNHGASTSGPIWSFTTEISYPPIFGLPSPINGSVGQTLSFIWSIPISDPDGDAFNWNIDCSNGQTNSATGDTNGTKTISLTSLTYSKTYTVWVNATDTGGSGLYKREWFIFTTFDNSPPNIPSDPEPFDGEIDVDIDTDISWSCSDPEGHFITYDIYFGDSSPPPLEQENLIETTYDPGTMNYETIYYWQIIAEDEYGASTDGPIWSFTTEIEPVPDLDCNGNLHWTEVKPGATVNGNITLENIGEPESLLDWEIDSYPNWGTWTFDPDSGTDLLAGDSVIIDVEVVAPDEKEQTFTGEVVLVNSENSTDTCVIDISLATPQGQVQPYQQIIFRYFQNYPILSQLLQKLILI